MFSAFERRKRAQEHRRNDGEVLGDVVRNRERRQGAARHQQLLADLDDLDQLRRVRVEIDHVAGFLRGLRAGVHRDADVRLSERRRVVGAVAGHRHELALGLLAPDQVHLGFGRRLGEEVVDAGFGGNGGRRQRVVAGDHHGADAHRPKMREPLADAALDDVLQVNHAERLRRSRRRPGACRQTARCAARCARSSSGHAAAALRDVAFDGVRRALANLASIQVDAGHAGARRERHEDGLLWRELTLAQAVSLLRQHDDRTPFRRFVGQRGELGGVGHLAIGPARRRG